MKRYFAILLATLFLLGCVPTPETEFVVNKGDNKAEQKLSGGETGAVQSFPDRWDEETYKVNDWLNIGFEADVISKADGTYPVYRTRKDTITGEEATEWATALLGTPAEVSTLEQTKDDWKREFQYRLDELAAKLAWIDAGKPDDGIDRDEYMPSQEEIDEMTAYYQEMIAKAPETNETKPVSDFRNMPNGSRRYKLADGSDAYIFVDEDYVGIARGGQSSPYVYYEYYYEDEKDEMGDDFPWPRLWTDVTMPREDAEAILQKELERIGFADFSIVSGCKANLMDSGIGDYRASAYVASKGWAFKLHRNLGNYPTVEVPYEPSQSLQYGTENTMANAYIPNEQLEILVDESGIQYFGFSNKKTVVGIENTNAPLLPWNEVQMRIKNALAVCYNVEWMKETNQVGNLLVYRVLLTSYTLHARDSEDYYEMPVWVVFYDELHWHDSERMRSNMDLMHDALFINAMDGSIIHTDWGI